MGRVQRAALISLVVTLSPMAAATAQAQGGKIDPCTLLTKAEVQKLVNTDKVFRTPPMRDELPGGRPVCTFDAGPSRLIEVIIGDWTSTKPFSTPAKSQAVAGIGDGAYSDQDAHGAAVFAKVGRYSLRLGVQDDKEAGEQLRPVAVAAAKLVAAKLK